MQDLIKVHIPFNQVPVFTASVQRRKVLGLRFLGITGVTGTCD